MEVVSIATGTLLLHWLQKRGRILTEIKVWSSNCLRVIICAIKNLGHSTRRTDLPRIAPGTPRTSGKKSFALFMRRLGPLSCEPLCPPPPRRPSCLFLFLPDHADNIHRLRRDPPTVTSSHQWTVYDNFNDAILGTLAARLLTPCPFTQLPAHPASPKCSVTSAGWASHI